MNRRDFLSNGLAMAAGVASAADLGPEQCCAAPKMVAVMAELQFAPGTGARAAEALRELARKTSAEPGCRRYVAARDLGDPDRFHLSELWDDIGALADHFASSHMAAFSATARALGYAAPFLKRIAIAELGELKPAELKLLRCTAREPQSAKGKSSPC